MNKMRTSMMLLTALVAAASGFPPRSERDLKEETAREAVSQYLLDEYEKIKGARAVVETEANTIRSLRNSQTEDCNDLEFKFDEIEVDFELLLHTNLHLYFNRVGGYFVTIRKKLDGDQYVKIWEVATTEEDVGWVKFELNLYNPANPFRPGDKTVHLKVEVTPSGDNEAAIDCYDPVLLSSGDEKMRPYLAVHTYDRRLEDIDYKSIITNLEESQPGERRKREANNIALDYNPVCQRNELWAPISRLSLQKSLGQGRILLPVDYFDPGVCGGVCGGTLPKVGKHSQLVHFLVTSNWRYHQDNTRFVQCCAPVAYKSLAVVFQKEGVDPKLITITNMQIDRCDCLEVVEFHQG